MLLRSWAHTAAGPMNKKSELKEILLSALASPDGLILQVLAGDSNRTQLAIAALQAARRELCEEYPEASNLLIKTIRKDTIAVYNPGAPDGG